MPAVGPPGYGSPVARGTRTAKGGASDDGLAAARSATSADGYVAALPRERAEDLERVLTTVRGALPEGYEETTAFGMVSWVVPLDVYPDTYNGRPLGYAALAAQKRHGSLYLMGLYGDAEREADFRRRWTATGRRLDMGRSCLRFRSADDLDLDLVAEVVGSLPVEDFVAVYERSRAR